MRKKNLLVLCSVLMFTIVLGACAGQSTPISSEEDAPQADAAPVDEVVEVDMPLTKLSYANADQMRVTYFWLYLPQALGYWEDEGLEVDVIPTGGSVEALQQLVADNAQIAQIGSAVSIQANVQESIPSQAIFINGVFQWRLAVLADGEVIDIADLAGTNIGVFSLSTNGLPFLTTYLSDQGLEEGDDYHYIPVGFGAPAVEALKNGEVSALYFWPSAFISMEAEGLELKYFGASDWEKYPDYGVFTTQPFFDENPEAIEGFVRGMTKASEFVQANPECAVRIFWSLYPDAKPSGDEATALASDIAFLKGQMLEAELQYESHGSEYWGIATVEDFAALQDFMVEVGLLETSVDPATLIIGDSDFYARVNNFDLAAIQADAANCPVE